MNEWQKLGLIFDPTDRFDWMQTHAQLPVPELIKDDLYRIYFASRNAQGYSQIGFVEIDINKPTKIINISVNPILKPGNIGNFDEHGVYPSCIINYKNKKYLYYIGWVKGTPSPLFYAAIGLAFSEDGGHTFKKYSEAPIMDRGIFDPCLVTSPFIIIEDNLWKMIYVSGIKWEKNNEKLVSYYHLKYAESKNGIEWNREGRIILNFASPEETNIARATIIKDNELYKMWFCYVTNKSAYKIGYAESENLIFWKRNDNLAGIELSIEGFDNQMQCYPYVFKHKNKTYMLYNGNNNGKNGFGLAVKDK